MYHGGPNAVLSDADLAYARSVEKIRSRIDVNLNVKGEVTLPVNDQNGNQRGVASIRPFVDRPPAGDPEWLQ
jgi:hypothetical protein